MRLLFLILLLIGRVALGSVDVVAVIGNHAVSSRDIVEQVNTLRLLYGISVVNEQNWSELANQALADITDVIILEGVGKPKAIKATKEELAGYLDNVRQGLKVSPDELEAFLEKHNTTLDALLTSLKVKILWRKLFEYEVEPKAKVVSARELSDFTETVQHNFVTLNTRYVLRHVTIGAGDLDQAYQGRLSSFVQRLRSCAKVDELAAQLGIKTINQSFESAFGDLDRNVQAAILSMSPPLVSALVPLRDSLQLVIVCSSSPGKAEESQVSAEQIQQLAVQHKRSLLVYQTMEKIRSQRFIDLRQMPSYQTYQGYDS